MYASTGQSSIYVRPQKYAGLTCAQHAWFAGRCTATRQRLEALYVLGSIIIIELRIQLLLNNLSCSSRAGSVGDGSGVSLSGRSDPT